MYIYIISYSYNHQIIKKKFEGARVESCGTQQPQQHLCFIDFFLFIQNIPKRINYIMKYLDSHLYRLFKI